VIVNSAKPGQAFEHAGGEILFNLPNGLQGYMLVDVQGRWIDEGPIEVVGNAPKIADTAAIVPGLSCMACHQLGVIAFPDTIRDGQAVVGDHRDAAQKLFLAQEAMNQLLAGDEGRFRRALDEATGAYLKVGEDRDKMSRDFPEPIGALARDYQRDLGPNEVAAELGLDDPKALAGMVRANPRLGEKGLAPLLRDAAIKRAHWDSLLEGRFNSRFQQVAGELELGSPFRVLEDLKP
jgi:serine/threonine-protein kinase